MMMLQQPGGPSENGAGFGGEGGVRWIAELEALLLQPLCDCKYHNLQTGEPDPSADEIIENGLGNSTCLATALGDRRWDIYFLSSPLSACAKEVHAMRSPWRWPVFLGDAWRTFTDRLRKWLQCRSDETTNLRSRRCRLGAWPGRLSRTTTECFAIHFPAEVDVALVRAFELRSSVQPVSCCSSG